MKFVKELILSALLITLIFAGSASALKNKYEHEPEEYVPYPAASIDLLSQYEPDYKNFRGIRIAKKLVYYQQRRIGEAIVEKDQIVYHFDKDTKELVDVIIAWREDLPGKLPKTISKERAESMVDGNIQFSQLIYISPESDVFPIKPTPKNPCWVVRSIDEGNMVITIIDAVEGRMLGYGVPPPYTAFSFSGPWDWNPCSGNWGPWYQNARDWFNIMGYDTEAMIWPTEDKVKSHIQSHTTVMFYEIAHGGETGFSQGCNDSTTAIEIEIWLADYSKMPFAFIGSCGGMCETGDGTLSYEFRKGSNEDTVTVGYCLDWPYCETCWGYSVDWQGAFFSYMNQGWTAKAAFDQANTVYPGCAIGCIRFAGDENFKVVPVVTREKPGDFNYDGKVDFVDLTFFTDSWLESGMWP